MSNDASFNVQYDSRADVLYIARRIEPAAKGIEDRYGIVWRYDGAGELLSATIMDFHDRWQDREVELAGRLSDRFGITARQMMVVLDHVHGTNHGP